VTVEGLPAAAGYRPGETYDFTVSLLGAAVPISLQTGCSLDPMGLVSAFNNRGGFNLEVSGGTLARVDAEDLAVQIAGEPQCEYFARVFRCGSVGQPVCPPCDDSVTTWQATHTPEGNDQLEWNLRWTAPAADHGSVRFYVAGNVVNGNCREDPGDMPTLTSGFEVPEGGASGGD
jgi:hypothetical protein